MRPWHKEEINNSPSPVFDRLVNRFLGSTMIYTTCHDYPSSSSLNITH